MTLIDEPLILELNQKLRQYACQLVTAESCTGGGLAYALTSIPGSSDWFERGFITYSNTAKKELLGVDADILTTYGAVSEQTARAMAEGALEHSEANVCMAITGIAGPNGGSAEKPVGTVWFGWQGLHMGVKTEMKLFTGDRTAIREQAIKTAMEILLQAF